MLMPGGEMVTLTPTEGEEATAEKRLNAASHAVVCKTGTGGAEGGAAFAVRVIHAAGAQEPSTVQVRANSGRRQARWGRGL